MYTLSFTLKQHTPIIHFQHDQNGATLRATEVKPKLDRFIIEKLEKSGVNVESRWFNNVQKRSLNYAMHITSDNIEVESFPKIYPCFFGNLGEEGNENSSNKKLLFLKRITINITTKIFSLHNAIQKYLPQLFIIANFGTRGSKGFGSLTEVNTRLNFFEETLKKEYSDVYRINWRTSSNIDIRQEHRFLFKKIEDEYKVLKSGTQKSTSKLKTYFNNRHDIEWEKPKLQSIIESITSTRLKVDRINNNYQYVRALLGLAENFEFPKQEIKISVKDGDVKNGIERLSSPILFKVFENFIYLMPNHHVDLNLISGHSFNFSFKKEKTNEVLNTQSLKVPDINFQVAEFLKESLSYSNWTKLK